MLREVEDFLTRDVVSEKLSSKSRSKIKSLLAKVTECIRNLIEQDKLGKHFADCRIAFVLLHVSKLQTRSYQNSAMRRNLHLQKTAIPQHQ